MYVKHVYAFYGMSPITITVTSNTNKCVVIYPHIGFVRGIFGFIDDNFVDSLLEVFE